MNVFSTNRLMLLSVVWVCVLFFGLIYGRGLWSESVDRQKIDQSSEIMIPRGLYQESFQVVFDRETRDLWQKPDQVIEALGIIDGFHVADIGCGEGYFTKRLAAHVGENGLVYATDIQNEVLQHMRDNLSEDLADRVKPILATEKELGIPEMVDLVFLVQVLGEVPNQRQFLMQIMEIMKPGSRLILIDSKHITDPETGYARPQNLARLLQDLEKSGLVPSEPPLHFLPKQFFFILEKKGSDES